MRRKAYKSRTGFRFRRIHHVDNDITRYEVLVGGKVIGIVRSREGFSYMGDRGWNSGIRYRDFHPTEWGYVVGGRNSVTSYSRREFAAEALFQEVQAPENGASE